jgi:hypothetical protein
MRSDQARRRSRRAALLQLAAHVLRRIPARGEAALVRELEARAAAELVPLPVEGGGLTSG